MSKNPFDGLHVFVVVSKYLFYSDLQDKHLLGYFSSQVKHKLLQAKHLLYPTSLYPGLQTHIPVNGSFTLLLSGSQSSQSALLFPLHVRQFAWHF